MHKIHIFADTGNFLGNKMRYFFIFCRKQSKMAEIQQSKQYNKPLCWSEFVVVN